MHAEHRRLHSLQDDPTQHHQLTMHAKHRLHSLQGPLLDHDARPTLALLSRLKQQPHPAGQPVLMLFQQLGRCRGRQAHTHSASRLMRGLLGRAGSLGCCLDPLSVKRDGACRLRLRS